MDSLEEKILYNKSAKNIKQWIRYVDDVFVIWDGTKRIQE